MRLIDADKLEIDTCYARSLNKVESIYDYSYSEKQIQNAPTVEAIPIKWLLEQSRKLPLTSEKGMYIDEILEDWEKENETN